MSPVVGSMEPEITREASIDSPFNSQSALSLLLNRLRLGTEGGRNRLSYNLIPHLFSHSPLSSASRTPAGNTPGGPLVTSNLFRDGQEPQSRQWGAHPHTPSLPFQRTQRGIPHSQTGRAYSKEGHQDQSPFHLTDEGQT